MAVAFPSHSEERDSANKMFRASESCSVCLDAVNDSGERSIAKLKCGHHFHLDCIGSAFNAKGAMQCPNCRHVEDGQWLYANGSRWNDDFSIEEIAYEDDYEVYQSMPSLVTGHDAFGHFEWCPYQHGLQPGGSSYPQFQVSLGEMDGPIGFPEVVVNVSYNYNDSGDASSPSLVCPHPAAHSRQSQSAEDSRLRPPAANSPMRALDLLGTSNGASMLGDGDVFNSSNNIWGPRHGVVNSVPGYSGDTPGLADGTRFSPEIDLSFLPRNGTGSTTFHGDTGSGLSTHERLRSWPWPRSETERATAWSWPRSETERATGPTSHSLGGNYSPQYSYNGSSHADGGGGPAAPCPRPNYMHGQVGTSQSQPQSSSLRSAPIGSGRRARQNVNPAPVMSAVRTASGHTSGELSRRSNQSWSELTASLGQEPPVPGLETHGSGYQSGGQGFVPWRRENASGPSTTLWLGSPEPLWQPGTRSTDLESNSFLHSDFSEGHGSSISRPQTSYELFRNSLYEDYSPPFGREGSADVGSSIPSSHGILLRPHR